MKQSMQWQCASFRELSTSQLYAILRARCDVFIVEQNCPFPEIDGLDESAMHLMAWTQDGQLAAYLRMHAAHAFSSEPALGRVLTTAPFRGTGLGRQLVEQGLKHAGEIYPNQALRINAQSYLIQFYGSFGFALDSEEYLEDGIPHVAMLLPVNCAR